MMPKMDGFELYELLKTVDPDVKVCFLTAIISSRGNVKIPAILTKQINKLSRFCQFMYVGNKEKIRDFIPLLPLLCHYLRCHYLRCHYLRCHYLRCHYLRCHYLRCHYLRCHYLRCHPLPFLCQLFDSLL